MLISRSWSLKRSFLHILKQLVLFWAQSRGALNVRKLFELQRKQQLAGSKGTEGKSDYAARKMEEKMNFIMEETQKRDILSSAFSKYEKAK